MNPLDQIKNTWLLTVYSGNTALLTQCKHKAMAKKYYNNISSVVLTLKCMENILN